MAASIFYSMGAFAGAFVIITCLSWLIDRYHGAEVDTSATVGDQVDYRLQEYPVYHDTHLEHVGIDSRVLVWEDGMLHELKVIGVNGERFLTNKTPGNRNSVWDRKTGQAVDGFGPGRIYALLVPEVSSEDNPV